MVYTLDERGLPKSGTGNVLELDGSGEVAQCECMRVSMVSDWEPALFQSP